MRLILLILMFSFSGAILSAQQLAPPSAPKAAVSDTVADVSPADSAWKEANSALEKRQFQDAQKKFDDFLRRYLSDPRAQEARIFSAICDYRQKRVVRALDSMNRVVSMEAMQKRASPALLLGLDQLAAHHRSEGKPEDWKKTVDQLFEFFPENPITIRELRLYARHCLIKGDYVQTLAIYERFENQLSEEDRQNMNLAKAMAESGADGSAMVRSANAQLEDNNPELAARLYTESLKRNLRDDEKYEAMTKLGWSLYLRKEFKKAEKLWRDVIESTPTGDKWAGDSRWKLIVLMTGPYNNAAAAQELCLIQAKEFEGKFMGEQALFARAWLYWVRKQWKEGKDAFDDLIRAYPEKALHPPIQEYLRDCEQGQSAQK